MSKKKARKARPAAENARAARRAGIVVWVCFLGVMAIGGTGAFLILGARHRHGHGPVGHDEETLIDLENARCPTCEDAAVDDLTVDWHHLRVHLARPECRTAFLSAPEEALDASAIDWRAAARTATQINHLSGRARDAVLSKAENRWHVLAPDDRGDEGGR